MTAVLGPADGARRGAGAEGLSTVAEDPAGTGAAERDLAGAAGGAAAAFAAGTGARGGAGTPPGRWSAGGADAGLGRSTIWFRQDGQITRTGASRGTETAARKLAEQCLQTISMN